MSRHAYLVVRNPKGENMKGSATISLHVVFFHIMMYEMSILLISQLRSYFLHHVCIQARILLISQLRSYSSVSWSNAASSLIPLVSFSLVSNTSIYSSLFSSRGELWSWEHGELCFWKPNLELCNSMLFFGRSYLLYWKWNVCKLASQWCWLNCSPSNAKFLCFSEKRNTKLSIQLFVSTIRNRGALFLICHITGKKPSFQMNGPSGSDIYFDRNLNIRVINK